VIYYENSLLSRFLKDCIGGNSLTVGIFCLEQGDFRKNMNTMGFYKMLKEIENYPIVNDSKAIGLLKRMR